MHGRDGLWAGRNDRTFGEVGLALPLMRAFPQPTKSQCQGPEREAENLKPDSQLTHLILRAYYSRLAYGAREIQ